MENCIVCLESNEDIFSRITTLSSEWIDGKMQRIIEKHLWWWYLKPSSQKENVLVRWICRRCWQEISSFHEFYCKAESAHRYYQHSASIKNKQETTVKLETSETVESPITELVLVKNRRRGRPKKQDNFEEKVFDIVEVKAEFCFSANVCDTNESARARSPNEDICVYDSHMHVYGGNDSNCNNLQNEEDNPLIHKSNIRKYQDKTKRKIQVVCSRKKVRKEMETKVTKLKENSNIDNFFKESQHKLECSICNVPFPDFRSLKGHCRSEHNTRGYAMCCGKKYFKRCLLVDHLTVHNDPNFFKCQLCAKSFTTRRGLEMHLETHKIRERKYNCDECGKSYFKLHIFERHKLTHIPESEKNFNCSQCNKKFASDFLRRQHEDSTHAKKHAKICDICGKSYSNSFSFLSHMREHSGAPKSMETCDICGVKLTNKYGLRQHMKMRHLEENLREQICPYCSRVSPNLNAHRKHIKYSHTMQRKHACHLCDKAFRRPLELKEHLCTHTGESLYTCPHCPRTFISNANMYKHRRIVHHKEWEESRLKKVNNSRGSTVSVGIINKADIQKISTVESSMNSHDL